MKVDDVRFGHQVVVVKREAKVCHVLRNEMPVGQAFFLINNDLRDGALPGYAWAVGISTALGHVRRSNK
jgi:hypothetical protein